MLCSALGPANTEHLMLTAKILCFRAHVVPQNPNLPLSTARMRCFGTISLLQHIKHVVFCASPSPTEAKTVMIYFRLEHAQLKDPLCITDAEQPCDAGAHVALPECFAQWKGGGQGLHQAFTPKSKAMANKAVTSSDRDLVCTAEAVARRLHVLCDGCGNSLGRRGNMASKSPYLVRLTPT